MADLWYSTDQNSVVQENTMDHGKISVTVRRFDPAKHFRRTRDVEWVPMLGPNGEPLKGIFCKEGVAGDKPDGTRIGADLIKMEPGAAFEPHEHEGDHVISFISGRGSVRMNDEDIEVEAGDRILIYGHYSHGVSVHQDATEPLVFDAMGHPHRSVHDPKRMRYVDKK
jgi:quercetin dioxygenase-like cupin family protein